MALVTVRVSAPLNRLIYINGDYSQAAGNSSNDSFTVNQGDFLDNPFGAGSPFFESDSRSDNLWAGKAQLDWHVNEDFLVYAGINRGVKAASYNAPLLGAFLGFKLVKYIPEKPYRVFIIVTTALAAIKLFL